jgi:prepilin-type N-terminal cleavage/methylation domain-containing protein
MIRPHSQSGFSLVETLVAITILLLVIVGPMSISSSAARSTSYSSEQVVAFFLAQEGAELAQKARDDLQLEYFENPTLTPWADFMGTTASDPYGRCFQAAGCGLQLIDGDSNGELDSPEDCGSNSCRLYINDAGGRARYTYDPSNAISTPYSRVVTMNATAATANREVEVVSRVSWQTGNQRQIQTVEVKTYLFNIYGN